MPKEELVDIVIEQIKRDIENGDVTAITELLHFVPEINLKSFLSEGPYYCLIGATTQSTSVTMILR